MDGRSLYNVGGDITGRGWELEAHDLMMMSQEKTQDLPELHMDGESIFLDSNDSLYFY